MTKVVDIIKDALRLTDKVEELSNKVTEMARAYREDSRDMQNKLHELDKRLVRIESLVEFTQKSIETKK